MPINNRDNNSLKISKEERREIIEKIINNYKEMISSKFKKFLAKIGKSLEYSIKANHRLLVVISGNSSEKNATLASKLIQYYERKYRRIAGRKELKLLYVFHDEFDDAKLRKDIVKRIVKEKTNMITTTIARYEESEKYLGTTFTLLVMDLVNDLKPNDVGRLVGIVEGGGLIIFITPHWEEWDKHITIFKRNLIVPGFNEPRHVFITWFKRKLLKSQAVFIYDTDSDEIVKSEEYRAKPLERREIKIPEETIFEEKLYKLALTQDQVNVVNLIEEVFIKKPDKKKKKVVLITANRGRGKSCAVGIGLAGLLALERKKRKKTRVIVTAPSASNVQSFYDLLIKALETLDIKYEVIKRHSNIIEVYGTWFSVEYWPPLSVINKKPDLVIADEAAGIPVPMLHKLWRKNKRLILATTIHGYEGVGRGFTVRFLPALKKDPKTEIFSYEMTEPIRYSEDDPIEKWLFETLLLDAEPEELDSKDYEDIQKGNLKYLKLDPVWLFSEEGEKTLRQLFGIYVLAHYRNEPDDLGMIADAPHHLVRAVQLPSGKIVCAIQIAEEGGLEERTIEDLLKGGKIPGNIIPDRLLKHARLMEFGKAKGWRIVRIATHPKAQGKGIGSYALNEIYEEAKQKGLDWVGSGFGVTPELLNFWAKNGFKVLHISPDRNIVSGEYTILVLKPISKEIEEAVEITSREFRRKLLESLHDTYRDLETDIAIEMLKSNKPILENYNPKLTPIQVDRLWIYSYGPMTYEAVCDVIHEIARSYWYMYPKTRGFNLSKKEEYILTGKALQGKKWETIAEELHMRTYTVMMTLKDIGRKFLYTFYRLTDESKIGLTLDVVLYTTKSSNEDKQSK